MYVWHWSVLLPLVKKPSPENCSHTELFAYENWKICTSELIVFFSVGMCIDGCKSSYKEDICIKSDKGKMMTVQSKCHHQCYEEYQGYSYAHHGKCKDSSKPSECMFEVTFVSFHSNYAFFWKILSSERNNHPAIWECFIRSFPWHSAR